MGSDYYRLYLFIEGEWLDYHRVYWRARTPKQLFAAKITDARRVPNTRYWQGALFAVLNNDNTVLACSVDAPVTALLDQLR